MLSRGTSGSRDLSQARVVRTLDARRIVDPSRMDAITESRGSCVPGFGCESRDGSRIRLQSDADTTIAQVLERITLEGPLRTSDFERVTGQPSLAGWDWTPEKTALEFLWHTGRLAIHNRDRFQKIYDLIDVFFRKRMARESPQEQEHIEWACSSALERLGVATPW